MSNLFPTYHLSEQMRVVDRLPIQTKGILNKGWYEHPELGLCLFKAATSPRIPIPNVRNDWVEKVVYEISKLLDLPTARYELALAWNEERQSFIPGSLSVNCLPLGAESIAGGDFLTNTLTNYEAGYPSSYSVENVLKALAQNEVGCPQNWVGIAGINRATDLFVGYLALDALCGGVDRHPNNWEVMVVNGRLDLVPSFDHGVSLGGNLSESTRVTISENNFDPDLMKSAFWNNTERINPLQAFEIATRLYPQVIWQQRIDRITPIQIRDIFNRLPNERITPAASRFATDLLEFNRHQLIAISNRED
jgi:hypothetical protein